MSCSLAPLASAQAVDDLPAQAWRIEASSRADLLKQLQSAATQWVAASMPPADVRLLGAWGVPASLKGVVHAQATWKPKVAGIRHLDMILHMDGEGASPHESKLRFLVQDQRQAWVLQRDVARGALLACEQLQPVWRADVPPSAMQMDHCNEARLGKVKRPLGMGAVLASTDVLPPDAMLQREPVRVLVNVGAVQIEAKGVVLTDAQIGQWVPVKIDGVPSVLKGEVMAQGEIRLTERR